MLKISRKIKDTKTCIICRQNAKKEFEIANYIIYKCLNCGFGFTNELKAHTGSYHRDDIYISEERLFKNIFNKRVKIIDKLIKPGSVLEVGCATGLLLYLFKKQGWQVKGIEISPKSAHSAIARGVEVLTTPFEKTQFSEKFDLIIFNHTLEHLQDPILVLKKARNTLRPKGYLYIDLPNFDALSSKTLKRYWPLLLPQEHLWHFTYKSLTILLNNLDFKVIKSERASGIWDFGNPLLELFQSLISFKKRFFINFLTALPTFIISKLGLGSDLMVIARKR